MDPVSDVLEHFGTKGMKWGVRNKSLPAANGFTPHTGVSSASAAKARDLHGKNKSPDSADVDDYGFENYVRKSGTDRSNHRLEINWAKDLYNAYENEKYYHAPKAKKNKKRNRMLVIDAAQAAETITSFTLRQSDSVDDILEHFGTKGMKWGVRKKRAPAGPNSADAQQVKEIINNIHKNGIGAASNADLKVIEGRAKLENKYKDIYPKKKSIIDHGAEIAKKVLLPVAEQQAKNFLNEKAAIALKGKEIVEAMELGKHSPGYGRHLKR